MEKVKRIVKCVITQEIADTKHYMSFDDCFAMAAMKEAGLTQDQANKYYSQVDRLPSTCGNGDFGEDLYAIDREMKCFISPSIPLEFEVIVEE